MTAITAQRSVSREDGFTLIELLVATLIMVSVTAGIFSVMNPGQGQFQTQPEVANMQQRLRIGVDTLHKDLVMAGAGTYTGQRAGALTYFVAPVLPYLAFGDNTDPSQNVFFRSDAISLLYVPPTPSQTTISSPMPPNSSEMKVNPQPNCPGGNQNQLCGFEVGQRLMIFDASGNWDTFTVTQVQDAAAHLQHKGQDFTVTYATGASVSEVKSVMYFLKADDAAKTYQLMYDNGWDGPVPVLDNVVKLQFEYFGDPQPPELITGKVLGQGTGPWTTYGPPPPPLTAKQTGWNVNGENCTFQVVDGKQVPRLQPIDGGGIGQVPLTEGMLKDGPWCPAADKPNRFDADVLRIRRIRVMVRVQASLSSMRGVSTALFTKAGTAKDGDRLVPDQEIRFDVTPRNMNLGR